MSSSTHLTVFLYPRLFDGFWYRDNSILTKSGETIALWVKNGYIETCVRPVQLRVGYIWTMWQPEYSSGCRSEQVCVCTFLLSGEQWGRWGLDPWPEDCTLQTQFPPDDSTRSGDWAAGRDGTPPGDIIFKIHYRRVTVCRHFSLCLLVYSNTAINSTPKINLLKHLRKGVH